MRRIAVLFGLLAVGATLAAPAAVLAATTTTTGTIPFGREPTHECEQPTNTGVEVSQLKNVQLATACWTALNLFIYEGEPAAKPVYGCRHPGAPYLKMTSFDGWHLTLTNSDGSTLRLSRGASSFVPSGTDFPVECS